MLRTVERVLPEVERREIRRAVASFEESSSAELVVYVVSESDDYPAAVWRAAACFGAAAAILAPFVGRWLAAKWDLPWGWLPLLWSALPPIAGGALGALVAGRSATVRRALVSASRRQAAVAARAECAFLGDEVFATRGRTGILLFVSLFEHLVHLRADRGVSQRVDDAEWRAITDRAAAGIGAGRLGPSLVEAVEACGRLVAARGLARGDDDRNELDDRIRVEE